MYHEQLVDNMSVIATFINDPLEIVCQYNATMPNVDSLPHVLKRLHPFDNIYHRKPARTRGCN